MSLVMFCFILATIDNFDYATPTAKSMFERIVLQSRHYEIETLQKGVRSNIFFTVKSYLFNFNETPAIKMAPILIQEVIRRSTLLKQTKGKLPT